jgi:hypothetical protein
MTRFAHFSKHALSRIGQRTKLNYFTIADILDYGGAVDVGTEPVFDRKHWLFYSEVDDSCFVAVQDALTGLVITVLPLDYHENLAWKVGEEDIGEAKSLATTFTPSSAKSSSAPPSIIIVKARYMSSEGYQKTATLTKFKASDYKSDLFKVLNDESFESEVERHCRRKGIDTSKIYEVSIALGNDGEPIAINWALSNDKNA